MIDVYAGLAAAPAAAGSDHAAADVWSALEAHLDVAGARPQLRDDIEVARFPLRDGGAEITVHNPRDRVYYRLTEAEADLLPRLDGSRTVADLVAEELASSGDLDSATVSDLVRLLQRGGFLADDYVDVTASLARAVDRAGAGWRGRVAEAVRTFDVQWRGADAAMQWLYRRVLHTLFTPAGKVAAALVGFGGFAAFIVVTESHDFSPAPRSLGLAVLLLFVLDMISVFIHETGHAMVLMHHGRRVNGAGFRLYFGTPAFYIESTDALMLGQRQRLWQSFAGPGFQAMATGVVSIGLLAFSDGGLSPLLWRFCALSYFTALLNLIPLLELDGYWILSDALRVRDLRPRSLAFVRRDLWWKLRHRKRFTRSDIGLTLYGTAGVAFTIAVTISAVLYWRRTFGGVIGRLVDAGPGGVAALAVLTPVIAGPVVSGAAGAARNLADKVRRLARKAQFRFERRWRVEAALLLDEQPLFDDLPAPLLNKLAGAVELVEVSKGQSVIRQGERGDAYYLARKGTFVVVAEGDDDSPESVLRIVGPGESFGEAALVNNAPRNATVRATSAAELFRISRSAFERLLADRAEVAEVAATIQQCAELRALPCFAHLGPAELADLAERGQWFTVPPGTDIVTQGDVGDAFYALQSGRLQVIQDGEHGRQIEPGEHFGELALLHNIPRIATVRALSPARVFRLDTDAFRALVCDAFRAGALRPNVLLDR